MHLLPPFAVLIVSVYGILIIAMQSNTFRPANFHFTVVIAEIIIRMMLFTKIIEFLEVLIDFLSDDEKTQVRNASYF